MIALSPYLKQSNSIIETNILILHPIFKIHVFCCWYILSVFYLSVFAGQAKS